MSSLFFRSSVLTTEFDLPLRLYIKWQRRPVRLFDGARQECLDPSVLCCLAAILERQRETRVLMPASLARSATRREVLYFRNAMRGRAARARQSWRSSPT